MKNWKAAEKPLGAVILSSSEGSRTALKMLRARFFAEFTLSRARSFAAAQDDSEGLTMTAWKGLPAAC